MEEEKTGRRLTVFIGHRQADQAVADVLKSILETWGNGQLTIFESSDVQEHAPRIGQNLATELRNGLADAKVVFLIYTFADQDWLYCMWQCGLATDPRGQGTRIVVFQCGPDIPSSLQNQLRVTIDEESVKRFTHDFHKEPSFFPGFNQAFAPELDEIEIPARSRDLFDRLRDTVHHMRMSED